MIFAFEGIDGSGKTTQVKKAKAFLSDEGYDVLVVKEPGGTPLGERVRSLLLDPELDIHPTAEAFLFAASRIHVVQEQIIPHLRKENGVVLCDRFTVSTIAYQSGFNGVTRNQVEWINDVATTGALDPLDSDKLVFIYFDIPAEEAAKRIKGNDRIESKGIEYLKRVRLHYVEEFNRGTMGHMVNAESSENEVFEEVKAIISYKLTKRS